uniref:Ig-like domain-containing protein n=1 Tax=Fundulus heteroclitus TaxID=8078 RepID=A0A3Q2QHG4_FUNHE
MYIFFLYIGLTAGSDVHQPDMLWRNQGDNATIECKHSKGASYYQMYWYRQLPGETMKQIVFTIANSKPDFEAEFKSEKFSVTKPDALSGTFTVSKLVPGDKGLYFCAVSDLSEAYFGSGTRLTVLAGKNITLPIVKIIQPSANECREQKSQKGKRRKTLVCVASDFYPDHVSVFWELNKQSITDGVATDPAAKMDAATGNYTITSRLRVLPWWSQTVSCKECLT